MLARRGILLLEPGQPTVPNTNYGNMVLTLLAPTTDYSCLATCKNAATRMNETQEAMPLCIENQRESELLGAEGTHVGSRGAVPAQQSRACLGAF